MNNLEEYLTEDSNIISEGIKNKIMFCLGIEEETKITPTASLTKDLGGDSLEIIYLFMEIEKDTGLRIEATIQDNSSLYQDGKEKAIEMVKDLQELVNILGKDFSST